MSKIGKYIRTKKHTSYVEKYVVELRNQLISQVCLHGAVDVNTRRLYLKYNNRLKELNNLK